ncbi:hypothetical protein COP1_003117 [Malus domestica]
MRERWKRSEARRDKTGKRNKSIIGVTRGEKKGSSRREIKGRVQLEELEELPLQQRAGDVGSAKNERKGCVGSYVERDSVSWKTEGQKKNIEKKMRSGNQGESCFAAGQRERAEKQK